MPQPGSPTITVRNFGPVKEGEFAIKPLTLFIGPNNSGKSYMALLVYALARALATILEDPFVFAFSKDLAEQRTELNDWFSEAYYGEPERVEELSPDLQQTLRYNLEEYTQKLQEQVAISLHDYFGYESAKELVRLNDSANALSVGVLGNDRDRPFMTIHLSTEDSACSVELAAPHLLLSQAPLDMLRMFGPTVVNFFTARSDYIVDEVVRDSWRKFLDEYGFLYSDAFYLPSARSGIMQAWQLFASAAVRVVRRRIGFEHTEAPLLQGVTGDFLQIFLDKLSGTKGPVDEESPMRPALDLLESRIFHGQVTFPEVRPEQPTMLYASGATQVPVARASSMVAELAPLDLWLKHLLKPGDLLIIDEPEAHLHPENQRLIARVLVRLAKAGVRVICPTHSPLILHQVSNLILASQLSAEEREQQKLDFTEDDMISSGEVGVYLFDVQHDGTHIRPVEIDAAFGISEEEFVRVAEAIGDESYRLALAGAGSENGHA